MSLLIICLRRSRFFNQRSYWFDVLSWHHGRFYIHSLLLIFKRNGLTFIMNPRLNLTFNLFSKICDSGWNVLRKKHNRVGSEKKIIKVNQNSIKCDLFLTLMPVNFWLLCFFFMPSSSTHLVHVSHNVGWFLYNFRHNWFKKINNSREIYLCEEIWNVVNQQNIHKMKINPLFFSAGLQAK